jgi:phosphoglycerate dehydrogenase-like enzyme
MGLRELMTNIVATFSDGDLGDLREPVLKVLGQVARVIFLSEISPEGRSRELASANVLISWHPARELQPAEFGMISHAKMMQLLSAGVDHLPFSQLPPTLTIASNAGAYAEPMAEHILAMTLAVAKNILDRHDKLKNGMFDQTDANRMLKDSTCAILGFGGIGKATARLLRCFGVKIYAINSTGKTNESVDFIGTLRNLEYVLRHSDVVVVALPLTNSTRGLIGSRELDWMKDSAILVNVARGEIIDEAALYAKLKADPSFTAAVDAWWNEPLRKGQFRTNYQFLELPNFLGSPHNSGLVPGSLTRGATYAAENVKRFLNHERVVGIIKRSDYT